MSRTDRDHLRVLSICHYVLGGLCVLLGLWPAMYIVIGAVFVDGGFAPPQPQPENAKGPPPPAPPPPEVGWLLIALGAMGVAMAWGLAAALVAAGRCLARRTARTFCLVTAGFACLFQPLGLILGIFTFIVLTRPGVRDAFDPRGDERSRDERSRHERDEFDTYYSE